jgi:hypothetical protein
MVPIVLKKTKPTYRITRSLYFLFLLVLPILGHAQGYEYPETFDEVPPDFEPPPPEPPVVSIDSFVIYFIFLGLLIAFYYLVIKVRKKINLDVTQQ